MDADRIESRLNQMDKTTEAILKSVTSMENRENPEIECYNLDLD